jgi:hypothetical protein
MCMYIYIYIYASVCVYDMRMYLFAYVTCLCICMHVYVRTYIHIYMHTITHLTYIRIECMCMYIHIYTYIQTHASHTYTQRSMPTASRLHTILLRGPPSGVPKPDVNLSANLFHMGSKSKQSGKHICKRKRQHSWSNQPREFLHEQRQHSRSKSRARYSTKQYL